MNVRNIMDVQELPASSVVQPKAKKSFKKLYSPLEYEIIGNLVLQNFQKEEQVCFDQLLSIPLKDRIPGLIEEYGVKRMHKLLVMIIKAFIYSLPIPRTRKLSETKISVCACDLILTAYEDQLSLEDVILFFERTKKGKYGIIKNLLHHQQVMLMLQTYRHERHDAYSKIKEEKEAALKKLGQAERLCDEPKPIHELMKQASVIDMNKRMSG